MTNAEFCGQLQKFINSKRAEWLLRGAEYRLSDLSPEKRTKAESIRKQAAALLANIATSDDPNGWAILSKNTAFDTIGAMDHRGELREGADGILDAILAGAHESWREPASEYESHFTSGDDLRRLYRRDARKFSAEQFPAFYSAHPVPTFEDRWPETDAA